jgi:hypothetical protein
MMTALLSVWAGLTIILIVLLIYRSTLVMHEDDQLFLDDASSHLAKEQAEITTKLNRIQPWVRICGAGSVALIVVIFGVFLYGMVGQMNRLP